MKRSDFCDLAQPVKRLLPIIVGAALGVIVSVGALGFVASRPVIQVVEASLMPGPIHPGGSFTIRSEVLKSRDCKVTVQRWLFRVKRDANGVEDTEYVPIDRNNASPLRRDQKVQIVKITLGVPSWLPPGDWFYLSNAFEDCPWILPIFQSQPTINAPLPIPVTADPDA